MTTTADEKENEATENENADAKKLDATRPKICTVLQQQKQKLETPQRKTTI